ncbi:MAG: hypothetical protein ABIE70_10330 [bacterium]
MSKKLLLTATMIGLLALGTVALAQNSMSDGVRALLERTDQVIEQAQEVISASNTPVAANSLQTALDLQDRAWRHYRSGPESSMELAAAKRLTLQALEIAQKAISKGRENNQSENSLLQKLEQTTTLVESAEELAGNHGSEVRSSVLESIRSTLNRAWEFYYNGQYRPALKLCNQVQQTARKVISSVNGGSRQQAQFERRSEFVMKDLERVQAAIADCNSERAPALLDQAWQSYTMATHLYDQGRFEAALKALPKARKLAEQAARECRGGQTIEGRLDRLTIEADRISEQVGASDEQGQKLLDLIQEQLKLAADYIEDGNTASATAALRGAELTLGQLKRHLKDSGM